MLMKISIVTATFNSAKTLRDNIKSVLSQTHQDFEHIIVDGLSSDETMQIVKECEPMYNGRLRYVSEKDTGIYNAMNKGIKMATGDAVGLLNSDDVFGDSMALTAISDAFEESNADCVFGKLYIVDQIDTSKVLRISNSGSYKDGAFFRGWHPAHPTFYVKTNCYRNLGYYNEELKIAADFELMLRFIEKEKISTKFIDKVLTLQRAGGVSTKFSGHIKSNLEIIRAFKMNGMSIPLTCLPRKVIPKVLNVLKLKLGIK